MGETYIQAVGESSRKHSKKEIRMIIIYEDGKIDFRHFDTVADAMKFVAAADDNIADVIDSSAGDVAEYAMGHLTGDIYAVIDEDAYPGYGGFGKEHGVTELAQMVPLDLVAEVDMDKRFPSPPGDDRNGTLRVYRVGLPKPWADSAWL